MTIRLYQFDREWQVDSEGYRNAKLVTLLSKLALALVMSAVVTITAMLG